MTISDAFTIAGAVIGSVGGAALIIGGLSTFLGKVWANRLLEQDKLRYTSELEQIKNQLTAFREKNQFVFSLYFEGQFKIYNDLWVALVELQHRVDQLWEEASPRNLKEFIGALQAAKRQIQNSALLVEPAHYVEIIEALKEFEDYRVGKERLVTFRRTADLPPWQIQEIIDGNRERRELIKSFTDRMLEKLRTQVRAGGLPNNG
jgi:hypothetical protein